MEIVGIVMGWIFALFMGLVAVVLLWRIYDGRIDISGLISEKDGSGASLSRFQFLIFTFVISMSLFLIIVSNDQPQFPQHIPGEILALLGISGGSYVVSKAVQKSAGDTSAQPGGPGTSGGAGGRNPAMARGSDATREHES